MTINYEIKENVAKLSERSNGWSKELNIASWNGQSDKFDIREWSPEHDKMGKGVTLSEDELWNLYNSLKEYFGEMKETSSCAPSKGQLTKRVKILSN